jgi:hypothetical protein
MKVLSAVVAMLVLSAMVAWCEETPAAGSTEQKPAISQAVFVCPDCHTLSLKAGKCGTCGKDLQSMHCLGTKDGMALVCGCGSECKCDASKMKEGKCGCGKDVVKVSVKGMYVCADGCPQISDAPGKCACGKDMVKVE